jgi:hypothetical protein
MYVRVQSSKMRYCYIRSSVWDKSINIHTYWYDVICTTANYKRSFHLCMRYDFCVQKYKRGVDPDYWDPGTTKILYRIEHKINSIPIVHFQQDWYFQTSCNHIKFHDLASCWINIDPFSNAMSKFWRTSLNILRILTQKRCHSAWKTFLPDFYTQRHTFLFKFSHRSIRCSGYTILTWGRNQWTELRNLFFRYLTKSYKKQQQK